MVVHAEQLHIDVSRGDASMTNTNYAATYQFGKTKVYVVAPEVSDEELEERIKAYTQVGWNIWNTFSYEEKLKINEEALRKRG